MGIKAIDEDAFDAIYKNNVDGVYYTALRYSGDHHAAEDITQTVFMKLYTELGNVNENAVGSWLLTSAKHMALNYKRGLKKEVLYSDFQCDENEKFSASTDLEKECIKGLHEKNCKELADNIFVELYHRNPRWYHALMVTYFLEKPQKEVAESMGVKLGALQGMLHRAKNWIKKNYKEQYNHLHED